MPSGSDDARHDGSLARDLQHVLNRRALIGAIALTVAGAVAWQFVRTAHGKANLTAIHLLSQFVVTKVEANAVYSGDPRYVCSIANLGNVATGLDFVVSDTAPEQITAQTLVMTGTAKKRYQASASVGIASA